MSAYRLDSAIDKALHNQSSPKLVGRGVDAGEIGGGG